MFPVQATPHSLAAWLGHVAAEQEGFCASAIERGRKNSVSFNIHGPYVLHVYITLSSTPWDTRDNFACFWHKVGYESLPM